VVAQTERGDGRVEVVLDLFVSSFYLYIEYVLELLGSCLLKLQLRVVVLSRVVMVSCRRREGKRERVRNIEV